MNEADHYKDFLQFRESLRWKWFFNKNKKPEEVDNNYVKKPWDTRSDKQAPVAHDCPELESFLSAIERDLTDPNLRRKIKSNLTPDEWSFIDEVQHEYPDKGLRVRREDKGHRFVITDSETEDQQIQDELGNVTYYNEVEEDPTENFKQRINNWVAKGSDKGEIDAKQAQFVTNLEETHAANPKPLYKTHKRDCNDNMVDPVPIRTLTVGVNTPVQPLSEFCQLGIEHLTSKKELPRRSKSII